MAKLNHQKRNRPKPVSTRRRRANIARTDEHRARRDLERWRKGS